MAENFHFDHKVFYAHQLNERGEVRDFDEPDLLNLAAWGHRASACDAATCHAVALGVAAAPEVVEENEDDNSISKGSDDAGERPADAGPFLCPDCNGKEFKSAAALGAHNSQKHKP